MTKTCATCKEPFQTKDSRQKSCSKTCADTQRTLWKPERTQGLPSTPRVSPLRATELPSPEDLPAPYAKRVHDMWASLIGDADSPTRIA